MTSKLQTTLMFALLPCWFACGTSAFDVCKRTAEQPKVWRDWRRGRKGKTQHEGTRGERREGGPDWRKENSPIIFDLFSHKKDKKVWSTTTRTILQVFFALKVVESRVGTRQPRPGGKSKYSACSLRHLLSPANLPLALGSNRGRRRRRKRCCCCLAKRGRKRMMKVEGVSNSSPAVYCPREKISVVIG